MVSTIFIGHLLKVLSKLESKSRAITCGMNRPAEMIIFRCSRPKTFQVDIQVFQNEMTRVVPRPPFNLMYANQSGIEAAETVEEHPWLWLLPRNPILQNKNDAAENPGRIHPPGKSSGQNGRHDTWWNHYHKDKQEEKRWHGEGTRRLFL